MATVNSVNNGATRLYHIKFKSSVYSVNFQQLEYYHFSATLTWALRSFETRLHTLRLMVPSRWGIRDTVSVLGLNSGYTVKYTPSPERVP